MAVVARKTKGGTVYWVATKWNGRLYWKRIGKNKREAEQVSKDFLKRVRDKTFQPDVGEDTKMSAGSYAETWLNQRTNETASDDRQRVRDHFMTHDISRLPIADVKPRHIIKWVRDLKAAGKIGEKTISNVYGAVRTMFRDALIAEAITADPCVLPRNELKRKRAEEPEIYSVDECIRLMTLPKAPDRRVLNAEAILTGQREGEFCGRRWRNLDLDAKPLGCLTVDRQYDGKKLKTDRPRKVPVHPLLAAILTEWRDHGFELVYGRKPTPDDYIVPKRQRRTAEGNHTKSSAYKAWIQSCKEAGVENRSLHSTRHTFLTLARRGGARREVIEKVTHNSSGSMVDQYTHWEWEPLCEAVLCLPFGSHLTPPPSDETPTDSTNDDGSQNVTIQQSAQESVVLSRVQFPALPQQNQPKTAAGESRVKRGVKLDEPTALDAVGSLLSDDPDEAWAIGLALALEGDQ